MGGIVARIIRGHPMSPAGREKPARPGRSAGGLGPVLAV